MGIDTYLAGLVADIDARWRAAGFDPVGFSAIAAEALTASPPHEVMSIERALQHLVSASPLPPQADPKDRFGQPPVTVAWGDGFHVDMLFWEAPATSIHSHAFAGAFAVCDGLSMHVTFAFEETQRFGLLATGSLTRVRADLLQPGSSEPIASGGGLVHQVAHVARPTLSLVVRTTEPVTQDPTWGHWPPGLAMAAPRWLSDASRKRLALARMVCRTRPERAEADLAALATGADDLLAAWLARTVATETGDPELALGLVGERPWVRTLERALACEARAPEFPWHFLTHTGLRLFATLAALDLTLAEARSAVASWAPGVDPADVVLGWLDAVEPMGLVSYLPPEARAVLHAGLTGRAPASALAPGQEHRLLAVREALRAHPFLKPWLEALD
jgi:hypothetical protein